MSDVESGDGGRGVNVPYAVPLRDSSGSIIILTNPEDELAKLELTLRGLVDNGEGGFRRVGDALLNDEGVSSVLGLVQSVVNRNSVLSELYDDKIISLVDFLADTLIKDLMLNNKRYMIVNNSSRDRIFFSCLSCAFICLSRARDGGERRFWKGSSQEMVIGNDSGGVKGKSLAGTILGWGGK